MKFWLILFGFLLIFSVPAVYLFTDVLFLSNEVTITATVPALESEPSVNPTSGAGGGGFAGGQQEQTGLRPGEEEAGVEAEADAEFETDTGAQEVVPEDLVPEEVAPEAITPESVKPAEPQVTEVYFGGYSFPNANISYSLNGGSVLTIQADTSGYFEGSYSAVEAGEQIFSFQSESYAGDESSLVSYAYTVQAGSPVYISGIVLSPILDVSAQGELGGLSIPGSEVQVYGIDSSDQSLHAVNTIQVNPDGTYALEFDLGESTVYDQYYVACEWKGLDCGFSGVIQVQQVGTSYKFEEVFADFTKDLTVNFIDFAFIRIAFLRGVNNPIYDLNQDGKIDLIDFSLLNYQWTL